ncbi:hypothetical protein M2132_001095 [Dysgonomonas sp. PH5-45]|uniref:type IX secretion system protein PorD n=1 Tax=unclassified Dysgonomonas TaxID=2630389 RepID=UPI00247611F9|nr:MULTISPECIES: DUF4835 family protein [unclassified Dysgonomonas]MDH6354764.1 hypothetical protein [Dysgonomonas sp. PH5-45]MDH6387663.1 hypothetical protein [Dysgonomonas sp. PH5-37]
MKKLISIVIFLFCILSTTNAQELNAKVTINSDKIQGVSKEIFTSLQENLQQILNDTRWTRTTFAARERIDCSFTLIINKVDGITYSGELQISSRRPVYNASYTTPIFNFRDVDVTFDYNQGERLEYNEAAVTNNLMGTISFYTYILIGLDFDSFGLNGGKYYYDQALTIANACQSSFIEDKGWKPFESDKNRYALALAFTEETTGEFHTIWYNYHRKGLDEMAANVSRGRTRIVECIPQLDNIYKTKSNSAVFVFLGDTKLEEIVSILSEATSEEKKESFDILQKIYPTKSSVLSKLKD